MSILSLDFMISSNFFPIQSCPSFPSIISSLALILPLPSIHLSSYPLTHPPIFLFIPLPLSFPSLSPSLPLTHPSTIFSKALN